ncbi:uncharacterized protein LOC107423170 isoform X2 [Ziziphus jujuba]|uniref:Uncharacterized protein LOC107423170 isoform X2 n=1 Tax=Ziziphus jujuba TaxID=326968 RepID=A0ABM3IQR8_ZIZJJ|nr:uncharacterized protein LOC107423170 isoform X2 [Ziziphus jujuba]
MAGGSNHPKGSSHKASSSFSASASHRKSRWESSTTTVAANTKNPSAGDHKQPKSKNDPSPKSGPTPSPAHSKPLTDPPHHPGAAGPVPSPGAVFPFMDPAAMGPPPPPAYGFHMLERRTIVLADGSVRSYFALPLDYQDLPPAPPPRPLDPAGRFLPVGPGGLGHHELGGGFDRRLPPAGGPMSPGGFNTHQDYWNSLGLDGRGHMEGSMKRKFTEEEEKDLRRDEKEELLKQRQQFMQYGHQNGFPVAGPGGRGGQFLSGASGEESRAAKYMRIGDSYENIGLRQSGGGGGGGGSSGNVGLKHLEVDQNALKKAFLNFCKLINENPHQRKNYLEEGKLSRLQCIACGRSSKEFPDMHSLIMHTYNSDNADLHVDHLGLHKALCALMGWNYSKPPDNSKAYQFLSADEAAKNQDDLIIWPPMVIIHNTITGKGKDGRMEGFGNKAMDNIIRAILEFPWGQPSCLFTCPLMLEVLGLNLTLPKTEKENEETAISVTVARFG